MMKFLQANLNKLPTFNEITKVYGPYLGLLLILIVVILILQYRWFIKVLKSKDAENKRLIEREQSLNERILHMLDKEIGYKKNQKPN